jgi:hypothetical protein
VSTPLQQPAATALPATIPVPGSPDAPAPNAPVVDPDALRRLGADLASKYVQYKSDRKLAELKWERNARQYLGIYDPEIERTMDKNRSRAYPKITRVKCVSMLSRLMNLLFPADDKNWTISPSAVPDLDQEDLQQVLDTLSPPPPPGSDMQSAGMPAAPPPAPPSDDAIEQAIRDFAKKRAARMGLEIEDQLQELGGNRQVDYVALCRRVLASGIQYGDGILKGPFVEEQQMRTWQPDANGRMQALAYTAYRPRFENCSLWDYYPDMSAKSFAQMDGQYERKVMSRHQVVMLKQRPDFIASQIEEFLRKWPQGNYVREAYETELRSMGVAINVSQAARNKYEAIVWEGYVHGRDLAAAGADVPEDKLDEDVRANVWIMDNYVVKAEIDPWSKLDTDGEMPMYHHFIFEEDESFLLGNGLPAIVRDSQLGVCAATRMALDNGAVQRNFEVNTALLRLDQDITSIEPDKIWYRDDDSPATAQYPAIRPIELPLHLAELTGLVKMFQEFADQETFVNAATGGDMQRGPSEPFRTATGASMLRGDAALPFKDVVRNFDVFTESVIGSMLIFNRNFNTNPQIKGDFQAVARGATSLIAKEVQGIQLDNLAQTLTPEEKVYIKMRELVRARIRVRDLESDDIVMNDAECDAVDQAQQANQQQQQANQQKMIEAQIREILAGALKDIAQAGKSTAAGEADTANVVLSAMEKGLAPDKVLPVLQGAGNATNGNPPGNPGAANAGAGDGQPGAGLPGGAGDGGAAPAPAAAAFAPGPGAAAMPAA